MLLGGRGDPIGKEGIGARLVFSSHKHACTIPKHILYGRPVACRTMVLDPKRVEEEEKEEGVRLIAIGSYDCTIHKATTV